MVNVPRALFKTRTGRQARYHIAIEETPEWAVLGRTIVAPQRISRRRMGSVEAQAARDAIELDHRDELVDWRDQFDLGR
jgi:hypothetical protein